MEGRVPRTSQQFPSHTVPPAQSEDKLRSLLHTEVVVNWVIP